MDKILLVADEVNKIQPLLLVENELIRNSFISNYRKHIRDDETEAIAFHAEQAFAFNRILQDAPALQKCTPFSLYLVFIDVILNNLDFDPKAKLCYVQQRNVNVGTYQSPKWEARAEFVVSPYGELQQRINAGQLRHADPVVVVYECDVMKVRTNEAGTTAVIYEATIPRTSKKIMGSFIKLTRADGTFLFEYMLQEDIDRLKGYSARNNRDGKANALYGGDGGQIDVGFLKAKQLKHSFKTFPKLKTRGLATVYEDEGGQGESEAVRTIRDQNGQQPQAPVTTQQPVHGQQQARTPDYDPMFDPNAQGIEKWPAKGQETPSQAATPPATPVPGGNPFFVPPNNGQVGRSVTYNDENF